MRDSRRAVLIVGVLMGVTLIGVSYAIVSEFATAQSRKELSNIVAAVPPILQGLAGAARGHGSVRQQFHWRPGRGSGRPDL